MANVGFATLTVSPSLRGMQASMQRQLGGIMPPAGRRAGQQLGSGIQTGTQSGVGRLSGAMGAVTGAVSATTGRIRDGFGGAFGAASRGASELGSQFRSMAGMGATLAAGLGFVNMTRDIYQVATGAQHTEAVLEGLYSTAGHGASEASVMMGLLNDRFSSSGIAMQAFQQGASDLAYLGLTAEETADILQFMEATISSTGGSAEELGRVTQALSSAQNAGRASAAELNQISQAGVPIYDMLADHLGIANDQIRDLTGSGELLVEDVLEAMQAQGGTWAGGLIDGAERADRTWNSAWASMRNTFVNGVANEVIPLLDRVSPAVQRMATGMGAAFGALPGMVSRVGQAMRDTGVTDALRTIGTGARDMATAAGPYLAAFATGFGVTMGALILALEPVGELLSTLGQWLQTNTELVQTFGTVLGALVGVLVVVKSAVAIGGAIAALANPVGLVITAVAALAAGLRYAWTNSETFRNVVTGVFERVREAVSAAVGWLTGTAWPAIQDFWESITAGASGTGQLWSQAWESIKDTFASVWEIIRDLWDSYGSVILSAIQLWVGFISSIWSGLWTALPGVLSGAWTIISGIISGALQIISGIFDVFIGLFTGDWQRLWEGLVGIVSGLWTAIASIFTGGIQAIWGILQGLWEIITGIWESIYDFLVGNSVVPDLVNAITAWFRSLSEWLSGILSALWGVITGIWQSISTAVSSVVSVIVSTVTSAWNVVRSVTNTVMTGVRAVVSAVWSAIRAAVSGDVSGVQNIISTAWTTVRTLTAGAWAAIQSAVSSAASNLLSRVRQIPSGIYNVFSNIGTRMRTIGRNIITGIINGVTGAASNLYSRMRNLASNALSAAKNALGISSPSRVFRDEVGEEVVAGLLSGLDAGQQQVDQSLADLVSARPTLGQVRVPVSPEVSRHAATHQRRTENQQREQQALAARSEALLRDVREAVRHQNGQDVVVQVDSQEIARANRRGEGRLARR